MATLHDIKLRAQALRQKIETASITAEEVGQLFLDLAEQLLLTERDGAILGIRKVYPSVDALQADTSAPVGTDGKPLRKGNLVVVYNKDTEKTDPNTGMVYIFRGDAWEMAGRLGNFDLVEIISQQLQGETTARTDGDNALRELITTLRADATKASQDLQAGIDTEAGRITELERQLQLSVTKRIEDDANLLLKIQAEATARTEGLASVDKRLGNVDLENFGDVQKQLHDRRAHSEEVDRKINAEVKAREEAITALEKKAKEYADSAGKIKVVKQNGIALPISTNGEVDITINNSINEAQVSAIVNTKIAGLKQPTFNADTEEVDEGTQVTLSTEEGHQVTQFTVRGGGGSGGDTQSAKVYLTLSTDKKVVQKGSRVVVRYGYDHKNTDGSDTGVGASATLTIQEGLKSPTVQSLALQPSTKTYELDLTDKAKEVGMLTVRLSVVAEDGLKKTVALTIDVRELSLRLQSTAPITQAVNGGHRGDIIVPYYISGAGTKSVVMLINGKERIADTAITAVGTTVRSLTIPTSVLVDGRNTVQMRAEADGLYSECLYFEVLYNPHGTIKSFIGLFIEDTGADFLTDTHLTPTVKVAQYEYTTVQFVSYGVNAIALSPDGNTFIPSQGLQTYTRRYKTAGIRQLTLSGDGASKAFSIEVGASSIGLDTSDVGLVLDLDADGRSNAEADKDKWESKGIRTTFTDVDFVSSGWESGALCLRGGASAEIGYKPFATDPIAKGWTLEVEVKTDTVLDDERPVVSCLDSGRGFAIYPSRAVLLTGKQTTVETENGKITKEQGISMALSTEDFTRLAFVVHTKANHRLMELYSNGSRIGSAIYDVDGTMAQASAKAITLSSSDANVSIRSIRAFDRTLSDDELLDSYIVSRTSEQEMLVIKERNDVLNAQGEYEAPRTAKRGRLIIKRKGGLAEVFQSTNKKEDFLCDEVRWESPYGKEYDFTCTNCYIRIQGTSSTKYPWKNIRIYLNKGVNPQLWVNGVLKTGQSGDAKADAKKNVYAMSPTAKAVSVITCKCDYSDSSMTHNTGGAKLWDYVCKQLGIVAPTQKLDPLARVSIEGYPCDIYNQEDDGKVTYYGQYNFNNDKSKSDAVWGMKDINAEAGACSLEFLNNTQPLCLFKTKDETEASFATFDDALEFNIPEDTLWATATEGQRTAIKRLWNFVGRCARACGAKVDDPEAQYNDLSRFNSAEFKERIKEFFDLDNLLLWWLFTDYLALVDQRAKNMIMRTMDGLLWWLTYYDGDTALLLRNDAFLAYLFNVNRNTYDLEANKYAFEGHSSWLWSLVQGTFAEELREMAGRLRRVMTNETILHYLNKEQMNAWSERAYNKSGALKYITPATVGTQFKDASGQVTTVKSNYIHALQGNRLAHRLHTVEHRGKYLDAMYITDSFRSDNIDAYINRSASDAPSIVKVVASEPYRYGYGTNNKPLLAVSPAVAKGEGVEVPISGAFTLNDPIRIYGASGIRTLDLTKINQAGASNFPLQNTLVLDKCVALREIRAEQVTEVQTANFVLGIGSVPTLEHVNVRNIRGISVGTAGAFDLSAQRRLKFLDARGTGAMGIAFASGALINEAYLPETLTTLTLRNLPRLVMSGLHFEGWAGITSLNFSACPLLSWQEVLAKCTALRYVRIEGVDLSGDGGDLDKWKTLGGISADGSIVDGARFVGRYQLTKFRDDIAGLRERFPELEIRQAKYTVLEQDELSKDNTIISNLDNNTGYRFGNAYAPSGHISRILAMRHWVMVRLSQEGTPTYTQLSDEDGTRYLNGTPAVQDGTNGVVCVYEPRYWYKGVNDWYGNKKYAIFTAEAPEASPAVKLQRTALKRESDTYINPGATLSLTGKAGYVAYRVPLGEEVKMVRWPALQDTITVAVFVDASGKVVKQLYNPSALQSGMYLVSEKPEGAVELVFQFKDALNDYFDHVVLSPTTDIADIEPDWVEHPATLVSACKHVQMDSGELLSVVSETAFGLFPVSSDVIKSTCARHGKGWTLLEYDQHKDVLWLSIAQWGQVGGTMSITEWIKTKSNGKSLAQPLSRRFKRNSASDHLYLRGEAWLPADYAHFMGYDALGNYAITRIGGILAQSSKWIIDERKSWKVVGGDYTTLMIHERHMDFLPLTLAGTSIARYGAKNESWGGNTFGVPRWGTVSFQSTSGDTPEWSIRLQYRGEMTEVSNEDYIALWK